MLQITCPLFYTQKFEKNSRQGRRGFKFEESWLLWEECETIVKEAWTLEHNGGHGLEVSSRKFRTVGINYELGVFLRPGQTMKTSNNSKKDWKI